ncbi:Alcohol dehydrogenase, class IV [Desulfomicrobium apsheronum]|uniref:Alcohol dehydrogenase, class IV n=1 Tax=Desulfomicrobium apsheronum TaxID=52560 RepID=A0A1I3S825_9BACT|nr:iron-containing alcohol dehydrogenase [Desulfomicrobium apsheronum]SFJ53759.1 Alcohol dehydrogenase, class IV [Desulfomicrobium apsheronum]
MIHTFQTVGKIIHGRGSSARIGDEVMRHGASRVFIIAGGSSIRNDCHKPLVESLARHDIPVEIFSGVSSEPTPSLVEECAACLRKFGADAVIGLGGGSVLDTAKAASLLAVSEGPLEKYFGVDLVPAPCLPTFLVPTTAGTGSEMTSISVVADVASNSKKAIVSDHLFARAVVLDPELTVSMPPRITASTGLDALVHAMESYVNLSATPFTDCPNVQAMGMIAASIREAYANGGNIEARENMLYASALAGMGFSNTQNGVIHAIAMAVPATYHIPHGLLVGALAPMGIAFNCLASPEKYARIAEILGSDVVGNNMDERAQSAVAGFEKLLFDLGVKPGLEAHGVKREDIRGIAERAAATRRLMDNNPRKGTADELEKLIERHF